jgi:hypothetical protein
MQRARLSLPSPLLLRYEAVACLFFFADFFFLRFFFVGPKLRVAVKCTIPQTQIIYRDWHNLEMLFLVTETPPPFRHTQCYRVQTDGSAKPIL